MSLMTVYAFGPRSIVMVLCRLLYIDSSEKKSEAVSYINQNFPRPEGTVIWLEGFYLHGQVHDYNGHSFSLYEIRSGPF